MPNHSTTIGASAIFGTLLMATMNGSTSRATNTEYHSASPSSDPKMVPMTKPRMASNSVYQVSDSKSPLAIILKPIGENPGRRSDQKGGDPAHPDADLPQREKADHGQRLQAPRGRAACRNRRGGAPRAACALAGELRRAS